MSESVKPTVDDRYWFELSKEMVQTATSSRNEAAAKLQTMTVWLWGIYTASAAVGIALSKMSYSLPIILLIASPSTVLIAAYWFAVWVQMPVRVQFDPRIPSDIKNAYVKGITTKTWKLNGALALSLVAAILVSSAIIAASLGKQVNPPNFRAYHHAKEGRDVIALSGHFPADTKVVLRITSFLRSGSPVMSKELLYVTSPSGELPANIEFDSTADKYEVTVEWKEEDSLVRSLKRTVLAESRENQQ